MSSDLVELGQQAVAEVSSGVANGAPLVKCQLLASAFYEALRHELRRADAAKRSTLLAAADQCYRTATANVSPIAMLSDLRRAIALLEVTLPPDERLPPLPSSRPVLRVIEGGLSRT